MSFTTPVDFEVKSSGADDAVGRPNPDLLTCRLDQSAKKRPYNTAIKFNNTDMSYKLLYEYSNKLARQLIDKDVKTGDIIGLALDRSPEMIVALIGILKAGAAYLPLDPSYPKDRIEFMLADSDAKMLLTERNYLDYFASNAAQFLLEEAWDCFNDCSADEVGTNICGDDLAYVLYTSGSTGQPKGVQITHGNLANFLTSMQKKPGIATTDKVLAISTISFDIAGLELFLPLINGAQIVLAATETARDGWLLLNLMREENITMMQATPYTWRMILAAGWDEFLPLRIISGGEPLPKELAAKLLPRCRELWNQYGPTETTVYSTQKLIVSVDDITVGKPIDNTDVYILDDNLDNVSNGLPGEIYIGGEGVAKGYLNRPELTTEKFVEDPFAGKPGARMYRSGDLGCVKPNGEIQCLGRIDSQVKVRGYRIELDEIEHAVLKQKGVKGCVVAIRTDNPDSPHLAAYIVAEDGIMLSGKKASLRCALNDLLPAYMVPDDFIFIKSIPVTPNGKIDRKALPAADFFAEEQEAVYVAPRIDTEKQLALIWQELMGLPKIGITDNFFELGGRSLVAVQIMARIEKLSGKRLPIATLLEYPTIEKLAGRLNLTYNPSKFKSLVPIKPGGSKTPLYIIHGEGLNVLYFNTLAINLDKEQPVYGLEALGLRGDTPLEVMEEIAANYVHEILSHNPDGPYHLAGYSFGGYVAVEMRKQLIALNKNVKLMIFDTDAEKSEYKSKLYLFPRKLKRHLPRLIKSLKNGIAAPLEVFKKPTRKDSVETTDSNESKRYYQRIQQIKAKLRVALYNYALEPFDDKVYLFKARTCTHYVDDTEFLGWKKYAKRGVEIYEVSGDHLSMLLAPNVNEFAQVLQQGIDKL